MNVNLKQITMEIANLCQIIVAKWNIIVRSLSAHTFAQHDCFSLKIDIQFSPKIMSTTITKSLAMNSTNALNKMVCETRNAAPFNLLMFFFSCSKKNEYSAFDVSTSLGCYFWLFFLFRSFVLLQINSLQLNRLKSPLQLKLHKDDWN